MEGGTRRWVGTVSSYKAGFECYKAPLDIYFLGGSTVTPIQSSARLHSRQPVLRGVGNIGIEEGSLSEEILIFRRPAQSVRQ